ncbi:MAG: seg [Parcubacteria group bacterium]|nr:seg [Parcubacteria group bacterium]
MNTITGIIQSLQNIINLLVPLVFAVAFLVFIYGIFRYFILGGANEEKRAEGRKLVMWGIIAFAIMISVWGLVNIITGTLNFGSKTRPEVPSFSGTGSSGSVTPNQNLLSPATVNSLQQGAAQESAQPATAPAPVQTNSDPAVQPHFIGPIDQ